MAFDRLEPADNTMISERELVTHLSQQPSVQLLQHMLQLLASASQHNNGASQIPVWQ